ncbi:AraC family transcriptional regulator [Rapidithrix thailandica]|uniref:AraC family transcriptional regulator n=1 Tax=Rapidithrix thailandica TaxID=413964 RepID=A0AAW9S0B1_9BACT
MEDYNKIIESLNIKFIRSTSLNAIKSVRIENYYDVQNTIFFIEKGMMNFGNENERAKEGDILFIPGGKSTSIVFGDNADVSITNEQFINQKEDYLRSRHHLELSQTPVVKFTSVTFDVKAFDSVNFFTSLDIPPFLVQEQLDLGHIVRKIYQETHNDLPGKSRVINLYTEELVIGLFRFVLDQKMFVEQLATNSNYFKDPRLIDIFNYIKNNLDGDLSNKALASVANVSEDYVGQYFKMLTGINPQDYIEYQRMEKAVDLLRTSKKSIRAIGAEVGYKDTAYFCRRFKMMFGIPAGKMRKRESLIDVSSESEA